MKKLLAPALLISIVFYSCSHHKENNANVLIDIKVADTAKNNMKVLEESYSSWFETKIVASFYANDLLTDTIANTVEKLDSWYSMLKDSTHLVVHLSNFSTNALLVKFIKDSIEVMYLRAAHDPRPIFKLNIKDTFSNFVEVPAKRYKLQLSSIPDTITKTPVYGFIDMETNDYYELQDSSTIKKRAQMKFYFRSQYKN